MYSGEEYVCRWKGKELVQVVIGPFTDNRAACKFIELQAEPTQFGTISRYHMAKYKLFARNKAGDQQLKDAIQYPDLAAPFQAALGRCGMYTDYNAENIEAARQLLPLA